LTEAERVERYMKEHLIPVLDIVTAACLARAKGDFAPCVEYGMSKAARDRYYWEMEQAGKELSISEEAMVALERERRRKEAFRILEREAAPPPKPPVPAVPVAPEERELLYATPDEQDAILTFIESRRRHLFNLTRLTKLDALHLFSIINAKLPEQFRPFTIEKKRAFLDWTAAEHRAGRNWSIWRDIRDFVESYLMSKGYYIAPSY